MMLSMMTALLVAGSPVSLQYNGALKGGLQQLAEKSGLNLVVLGELDEKVQLNLPNVDGEEALETIADAYGLQVTRSGKASKLWVVRKAPPAPVALTIPLVPPPPAIPAVPVAPDAQAMRDGAEQAREAADTARAEADRLQQQLESLESGSADAREKAQEAVDEAREKAREAADDAKEKAQELAEAQREQAQAQADLDREKARLDRTRADLERHAVSTGGPVTVAKDTQVDTAVAYGGPVIVEENAVVGGDAVAFGGDVILKKGAVVEGDAVSFGGNVVREPGSAVHGESVSMGGSGLGTTVARNMVKTQRSARVSDAEDADAPSGGFGRGLAGFLLQFAVFFGLGFLLMMFAPQRMKALEATVRAEPGRNGLAGFLGLLATVPLTIMLVVTLVGIPVAVLMWIAIALFVPIGVAVVANAVGAKLPTGRLRKTQALVLAVGLLAVLLVGQVPVLGTLAMLVAVFVSMGAIIRTRFGQTPRGTPMLDPMQTAPVL